MANLSPTEIVKPGRPAIFVDKIWKYNGRKPIFQMVDGKSFTARGCIVGDYEYDAGAPAAPATHKKNANEVKRALKPGVKPDKPMVKPERPMVKPDKMKKPKIDRHKLRVKKIPKLQPDHKIKGDK